MLASGTFFVYEEMVFFFGGRLAARLGPGVNTGTYQSALPLQRDRVDRLGNYEIKNVNWDLGGVNIVGKNLNNCFQFAVRPAPATRPSQSASQAQGPTKSLYSAPRITSLSETSPITRLEEESLRGISTKLGNLVWPKT